MFDGDVSIGWCNANDRENYTTIGEFEEKYKALGIKVPKVFSISCNQMPLLFI